MKIAEVLGGEIDLGLGGDVGAVGAFNFAGDRFERAAHLVVNEVELFDAVVIGGGDFHGDAIVGIGANVGARLGDLHDGDFIGLHDEMIELGVRAFVTVGVGQFDGTIILLTLINGVLGLVVLLEGTKGRADATPRIAAFVLLAAIVVAGIFSPDPFYYIIKKMVYSDPSKNMEIYYHKEGVAATTTALGSKNNVLNKEIFINGIGMTTLVRAL